MNFLNKYKNLLLVEQTYKYIHDKLASSTNDSEIIRIDKKAIFSIEKIKVNARPNINTIKFDGFDLTNLKSLGKYINIIEYFNINQKKILVYKYL